MKRDFNRAPLILLLGTLAQACQSERTDPVDPPADARQFELTAVYDTAPLSGTIFTTTSTARSSTRTYPAPLVVEST